MSLEPGSGRIVQPWNSQAIAAGKARPGKRFALARPAFHAAADRERTDGHGHGMSRNRTPKDNPSLPHERGRDNKQPYSREVEEYSGGGVAKPPKEETGRRDEPRPPRRP